MSEIEFGHHLVAELKPDPRNARSHSKKQVDQIAASIRENGFVNPILINVSHVVIAGHGRLRAARQLGLQSVATITIRGLTEAQERRLRIADNKIAQNASWDMDLLKVELGELEALGLDLELSGFSMGEIDVLRTLKLEPDEIPLPPPGPTVTRLGDVWRCEAHRIACGDLLDDTSLTALMAGRSAQAMFIDPPYNTSNLTHNGGNGAIKHREFAYAHGEMSSPEFTEFLARTEGVLAAVMDAEAIAFVCMDHHHVGEQIAAGDKVFGRRLNICVWVKSNAGMGSLYRSQHELVFVYKVGNGRHRNNVELGKHGRSRTNVWEYGSVNTFGGSRREELALHPTCKPIALVADAIKDVTARGDIVLDGFLGSGTTLIAAEQAGRTAYGLEIDPAYVDTAVLRWEALTNNAARLEETGETFQEVKARRDGGQDER